MTTAYDEAVAALSRLAKIDPLDEGDLPFINSSREMEARIRFAEAAVARLSAPKEPDDITTAIENVKRGLGDTLRPDVYLADLATIEQAYDDAVAARREAEGAMREVLDSHGDYEEFDPLRRVLGLPLYDSTESWKRRGEEAARLYKEERMTDREDGRP